MLDGLKRQKTLILGLALVIFPLVVYRANASDPTRRPPLDRVVIFFTAPLERALAWTVGAISDGWSGYADARGARADNGALRREKLRLEQQLDALSGVEAENERLRGLLGLAERNPKLALVAARVIAASTSPLERTLRVDRGLSHGVGRGMGVISDRGLVGRVQRAGYAWADVALISDEKVSLDVVLGRSRVRGRLRGSGLWPAARLEILDVPRTDDVRVGDIVQTSGLAGVFPPNIPVGRVVSVDAVAGGGELLIEAEPLVPLARLEEVAIVVGPPSEAEPLVTPDELLPPELMAPKTSTTSTQAAS